MEIWIQFLTEVIYLGWKLAIIMSWVLCEFKADLMVAHNLNNIQTWVKKAGGRVVVELISILNLMKFRFFQYFLLFLSSIIVTLIEIIIKKKNFDWW